MANRRQGNSDDGMMGCLAIVILAIIAMPIVGVVMMISKEQEKKTIGLILTIIGVVLWIVIGVNS